MRSWFEWRILTFPLFLQSFPSSINWMEKRELRHEINRTGTIVAELVLIELKRVFLQLVWMTHAHVASFFEITSLIHHLNTKIRAEAWDLSNLRTDSRTRFNRIKTNFCVAVLKDTCSLCFFFAITSLVNHLNLEMKNEARDLSNFNDSGRTCFNRIKTSCHATGLHDAC